MTIMPQAPSVYENVNVLAYSIEGFEIADETEQAQDGVVATREMEIAHIRREELPCRVFLLRNADKGRVEI
jgi:hypothetical protein